MSGTGNASGKNVIYITAEELDKLPKDSTVYVLSTDKDKHKNFDAGENSEGSPTKAALALSASTSAFSVTGHSTTLTLPVVTSPLACSYQTLPHTCLLPSNHLALYPVATYFPPPFGPSYPPQCPFVPPIVSPSDSSWFPPPMAFPTHHIPIPNVVHREAVPLPLEIKSLPSSTSLPIFNPSEPPPAIMPSKVIADSQNVTGPIPSLASRRNAPFVQCCREQALR